MQLQGEDFESGLESCIQGKNPFGMEVKCVLWGPATGAVFIPIPVRGVGPCTCTQVVGLVCQGMKTSFLSLFFPCQIRWELSAEQH